jgi:pyridoxamine--pyruvate transaminase
MDQDQALIEAGWGRPVFNFSAGPSGVTDPTRAALGRPVLYHYDPAFRQLYGSVIRRLGQAFACHESPVILQGEAVLGLEAAAASLISAEDVVLNLVSGIFGKGFGFWARRYAREVIDLEVPYDEVNQPEDVRRALQAHPEVTIVAAVHCETPSGTINPISEIAPLVRDAGALLLVDAVASFGGMRVVPSGWPADLVVVGPQKCLGGPPGLSLLYVSDRAWAHMESNPAAPRASILSILDWRGAEENTDEFPFTPSVADINALDACLAQFLAEGAQAVQRRHDRVARAVRAGGKALGLSLWPRDEATCSDTVTAFAVPAGVDEGRVRARARADMGAMLSGGQGALTGKVIRVGHMGPSAQPHTPVLALAALGKSLRAEGFPADVGSAVEAAVAALGE